MDINQLKSKLLTLDLNNFKLIQTKSNSLLLLKSKYKFSDCIYINLYKNRVEIINDRVFDNKYFYTGIERLLISKTCINNQEEIIKYINNILSKKALYN